MPAQTRFYRVGGCVRDKLLREAGFDAASCDTDYVVTGATPEAMIARGFLPVGADFPVFLHPETHEEYALARTERKTARGYHGFQFYASPEVTLEEDLKRRDLTVNAMAEDAQGNIIDPYGGMCDLQARVLRHVSEAFCEDPVRILRLARFAARLPEFTVAPETEALAASMVKNGEVDALTAERVWQELRRGLMEKAPCRMFEVLIKCGLWQRLFSQIPFTQEVSRALENAALLGLNLACRTALLTRRVADDKVLREVLQTLRVESDTISTAALYLRIEKTIENAHTAENYAALLGTSDVLRRPGRFNDVLAAFKAAHPGFDDKKLVCARTAYVSLNAGKVVRAVCGRNVAQAVKDARLSAVHKALTESSRDLHHLS